MLGAGHADDDYIAEAEIDLNSGQDASLYVRYLDPDNWYRIVVKSDGIRLDKMFQGELRTVPSKGPFTYVQWGKGKVVCSGESNKAGQARTQKGRACPEEHSMRTPMQATKGKHGAVSHAIRPSDRQSPSAPRSRGCCHSGNRRIAEPP